MSTRASDNDRADVSNLLREAAAEGRLTIDELSERIGEAMSSKTYADLHRCLRELPSYDSYKPWYKTMVSDVEVVGTGNYRRKGGLGILLPVVVGVISIVVLMALSGLVASVILMPVQIVLNVVLLILVFKVVRFFLLHLRH